DFPYEWPTEATPRGCLLSLGVVILAIVSFAMGAWNVGTTILLVLCVICWTVAECRRREFEQRFSAAGEIEAWPFLRREDHDEALKSIPLGDAR
ncbi:MAG: hypothetical protein N2C14_32860, partial [Planctomycetales bacterium]